MNDATNKPKHPLTWVPTLFTVEGIPFVIISVATSLMYSNMGVSNTKIAFWTSLVGFAWAFKPLWVPFLEMYRTKKFFVLLTQTTMGVAFGLLAIALQMPAFFVLSLIAFSVIAFSSAVHDTAADGLYLNSMNQRVQAKYVGWVSTAYQIGKVLGTGALPILAGKLMKSYGVFTGWSIVMAAFGGLFVAFALYHAYFLPSGGERVADVKTARETLATFGDVFVTFFQKKYIWWGIAFMVIFRFVEGQAMRIFPLFLIDSRAKGGLGLTTAEVGWVYGILPPMGLAIGALVSGNFAARRGLRASLMPLCCAFNLPFLIYTYIVTFRPESLALVTGLVTLEYVGYGFGYNAVILFGMQQIAPGKYKTAHYAIAASFMTLGYQFPSMLSGWLSDVFGYQKFFIYIVFATIPTFLISKFVPLKDASEGAEAPVGA